uniref:Uncharacterized protein n=1 Tax=Solanum tuberosum TaxID=4113 RepID=M1DHQ9_SOLTU
MKKRNLGDRQVRLASHRVAIQPPKVPVCQALKERTKLARERSSQQITEWFRNAVCVRLKLQTLRMLKAKIERLKGGMCLKTGDWRAKCPVGNSQKRLASPTWTVVGLKIFYGFKSSNDQFWLNQGKSKYPDDMGVMGLSLIVLVYALILISGVAGLILEIVVESRHVGQFGELGRARRTTQRFTESPLIAFNFRLLLSFGSVTFDEKPEFTECTR